MAINDKTRARVAGLAALRCAICREELLLEARPGVGVSITGELCHIHARRRRGPRFETSMTHKQLDDYDNLILLCLAHHKHIDDFPDHYPAQVLRDLKAKHEEWVRNELSKSVPWQLNVSQFTYLNIPRLSILAAMHDRLINVPLAPGQTLHSLGGGLLQVFGQCARLLQEITLRAVELPDSFHKADDRLAGMTFSFDSRFRTKNMRGRRMDEAQPLIGDISQDPYIYKKLGEWKLILAIDPKWITTTTAWGEFMPSAGHRVFAGLCTVKSVEKRNKKIYATPLLIGFPKSPWDEFLTTSARTLEVPGGFG